VTLEFRSGGQSGLELRPAVKRVSALPRLHLHELPDDTELLTLGELAERVTLSLDASLTGLAQMSTRECR
jgi:hypothetical protein